MPVKNTKIKKKPYTCPNICFRTVLLMVLKTFERTKTYKDGETNLIVYFYSFLKFFYNTVEFKMYKLTHKGRKWKRKQLRN